MTCSEARLTANRLNARKSTGPRTVEGKRSSSRNALKHGFCARASALAPLEDRPAYDAFTAAIVHSLHPATPLEEELANRIADLSWRLRRVPDAEAALLARDTAHDLTRRCRRHLLDDQHNGGGGRDGNVDEANAVAAGDHLFPDSPDRLLAAAMRGPQNPYLTLQRYEQSLDRARSRALKELRQLQKDRRENPNEDEDALRRSAPKAPAPPEGEGRGEGERRENQHAHEPRRNEPTTPRQRTSDQGPMTPTEELRNEPNPPSVSSVSSVSSVTEQSPQSKIANPNSQVDRPPQRFILTRSDLRPIPPAPDPARPASGSHSPAS